MGKIHGINSDLSGKVGEIVYRKTKKGVVVAQAPTKAGTPRRSEKQMYLRCQIGNEAANFRLFDGKLAQGFEDKAEGQSEFNMFVQCNYGVNPVFLTKQERLNGACVVAPYQFCRGTLKSIDISVNSDGILVSNIALGDLVIDSATTIAQLTTAILKYNTGWEDLDQITFFYAEQSRDPMSNVPRATMDSYRVVLDLSNETPLYTNVTELGFSTVNGRLGMNAALENAGAAWAHTREKEDGNISVGSQRLVVVSDLLGEYQTAAAMRASANSYGGINTKLAYLNPSSTALSYAMADSSAADNTPSGTDNAGSGSSDAGGSGSSTGGDTGGSSGGYTDGDDTPPGNED